MTAASPAGVAAPVLVRSRRPGGWLYGIAGTGWLALVVLALPGGHAGHSAAPLGTHVAGWVAMVAVTAPLIAPNVRYAAMRSPSRARGVVAVDVVSGWALVWAGAAVVLAVGTGLLVAGLGQTAAVVVTTVVAAAWQWVRLKRRAVARCGRRLAPPMDPGRARRAARRYGTDLGRDCVLSCWPLMALMAAAGHSVLVTAACVAVAWYERRRRPHHDPATYTTSLAVVAIGSVVLATGA